MVGLAVRVRVGLEVGERVICTIGERVGSVDGCIVGLKVPMQLYS